MMYGRSDMSADLEHLLVLRVFATFLVVFGHAASFFGVFDSTQWPQLPYIQSTAVIVFFCVSGFTIAWVCDTRSLRGWRGFQTFAFDRYARLVIPLVPALIIFGIAEFIWLQKLSPYTENLTIWDAIGNALFLQNLSVQSPLGSFFLNVEPFGTNRPLWTLSIEFWVYILFGAMFFFLVSSGVERLCLLAVGCFAISLVYPIFYTGHGAGLPIVWFLGAGFYFIKSRLAHPPALLRFVCAVSALFCVSALWYEPFWSRAEYGIEYLLLVPCGFMLLMLAVSGWRLTKRLMQPISFIGGFCYTVYLTHYPIQFVASLILPASEVLVIALTLACFLFGWIFALPFEARYKLIRASWRKRLSRMRQDAG